MIDHLLDLLNHIRLTEPTSQLVPALQEEGAIGVAPGLLLLHLVHLLLLLIAQVFLGPSWGVWWELLQLARHPKQHCWLLLVGALFLSRTQSSSSLVAECKWRTDALCRSSMGVVGGCWDRRYGPLTLIIALTSACSGCPLELLR